MAQNQRNVPRSSGRKPKGHPWYLTAGSVLAKPFEYMPGIGPAIQKARAEAAIKKIAEEQSQFRQQFEPMAMGELSPIQQMQQQRHMQQLNQTLRGIGQRFGAAAGARGQANSPSARAYNQRIQSEMAQRSLAGLANTQAQQQMRAAGLVSGLYGQNLQARLQQWNQASMNAALDGQTIGSIVEIMTMGQSDVQLQKALNDLFREYGLALPQGGTAIPGPMVDPVPSSYIG